VSLRTFQGAANRGCADFQDLLVEKHQGVERLILGRGGDVMVYSLEIGLFGGNVVVLAPDNVS
jgi:hypothetical protein